MDQGSVVAWPRLEARIACFLYLSVIILGGFAEIMTHQNLFRLGSAAEMMTKHYRHSTILIIYRLLAPAGSWLCSAWLLT